MKDSKLTNEEKLQNNQVVYKEVCESRRRQHTDIELLNNKINWLLASSLIILGFLLSAGLNNNSIYLLVFVFVLISVVFCLISIFARDYKDGPKLKDAHSKRNEIQNFELLASINKRIIEDLKNNESQIKNFKLAIITSSAFLLIALILITITFFELCK